MGVGTDVALVRFVAETLHHDYEATRGLYQTNVTKRQWPFNSQKKRMSTAVKKENKIHFFVKGIASPIPNDRCSSAPVVSGKQ